MINASIMNKLAYSLQVLDEATRWKRWSAISLQSTSHGGTSVASRGEGDHLGQATFGGYGGRSCLVVPLRGTDGRSLSFSPLSGAHGAGDTDHGMLPEGVEGGSFRGNGLGSL